MGALEHGAKFSSWFHPYAMGDFFFLSFFFALSGMNCEDEMRDDDSGRMGPTHTRAHVVVCFPVDDPVRCHGRAQYCGEMTGH